MNEKLLLFNRWSTEGVQIPDLGLKNKINLKPVVVPRSGGRYATIAFHKNDMNVVERFINKLYVPGHKGKKHKIASGELVGQSIVVMTAVKKAFEMIEKKANKNPVQVLVDAIINAAPYEEVAAYRLGGIIARKAIVVSPQRRLDLALRFITQGIFRATFRHNITFEDAITKELLAIASNDPKTFAVMERSRLEKEAEGAR